MRPVKALRLCQHGTDYRIYNWYRCSIEEGTDPAGIKRFCQDISENMEKQNVICPYNQMSFSIKRNEVPIHTSTWMNLKHFAK